MHRELSKIIGTKLGLESGVLTFMIILSSDGSSQGFGGWRMRIPLDALTKNINQFIIPVFGIECIYQILRVFHVDKWEDLIGEEAYTLRKTPYSTIDAIMDLDEKITFNISDTNILITEKLKTLTYER